MASQINLGVNVNLNDIIPEFKSSYEKFKENKVFNKETYNELLKKYSESIEIIEKLKIQIEELNRKKLPTKDEIESVSAMMDVLGKLDSKMIKKINKLNNL